MLRAIINQSKMFSVLNILQLRQKNSIKFRLSIKDSYYHGNNWVLSVDLLYQLCRWKIPIANSPVQRRSPAVGHELAHRARSWHHYDWSDSICVSLQFGYLGTNYLSFIHHIEVYTIQIQNMRNFERKEVPACQWMCWIWKLNFLCTRGVSSRHLKKLALRKQSSVLPWSCLYFGGGWEQTRLFNLLHLPSKTWVKTPGWTTCFATLRWFIGADRAALRNGRFSLNPEFSKSRNLTDLT